jgi:hypothetical protein
MRALPSRRSVLAGGPALIASGIVPTSVATQTAATPTLYSSDYYSFAGRDEKGAVYLAHDSNRGQTGDAFLADHWIAMYDDATGWIDVKGSAHYPNPDKVLDRIPMASPTCAFQFRPKAGTINLKRGDDDDGDASTQTNDRGRVPALVPGPGGPLRACRWHSRTDARNGWRQHSA